MTTLATRTPLTDDMLEFLGQNTLCAAGMSFAQIQHADDYRLAHHYSGGLVVLQGEINEGTSKITAYVKMHDSWGPEYEAIVHCYDADDEDSNVDTVKTFTNPREAADYFFTLLSIEMGDK